MERWLSDYVCVESTKDIQKELMAVRCHFNNFHHLHLCRNCKGLMQEQTYIYIAKAFWFY